LWLPGSLGWRNFDRTSWSWTIYSINPKTKKNWDHTDNKEKNVWRPACCYAGRSVGIVDRREKMKNNLFWRPWSLKPYMNRDVIPPGFIEFRVGHRSIGFYLKRRCILSFHQKIYNYTILMLIWYCRIFASTCVSVYM
jgi:hypothetical protein